MVAARVGGDAVRRPLLVHGGRKVSAPLCARAAAFQLCQFDPAGHRWLLFHELGVVFGLFVNEGLDSSDQLFGLSAVAFEFTQQVGKVVALVLLFLCVRPLLL